MKNLIDYHKRAFWSELSLQQYWKFLLAIFFLFASIGFVIDIINGGGFLLHELVIIVIATGSLAGIWVYGFNNNYRWLIVGSIFMVFYFLWLWNTGSSGGLSEPNQSRLFIDGFGILAAIIIGFILLVDFVLREGVRHVEYRTEIQLARKMHETLVPPIDLQTEHYQIFGQSIPTTEVGGDIIDVHTDGNDIISYIGDISGHGVAAGVMMSMFKTAMHTGFRHHESLVEVLNQANGVLSDLKRPNMFLTCSCLRMGLDGSTEYIVAGHLPIIYYNSAEDIFTQLRTGHLPLSVDSDLEYKSKLTQCNPGDLLVLATDGLTEVMDEQEKEYGIDRLTNTIGQVKTESPDRIFHTLLESVRSHGPQFDDQTLLVIKIT